MRMQQQKACRNVSAIRVAQCNQFVLCHTVILCSGLEEIVQLMRLKLQIVDVEYSFREASEKPGHAVFDHAPPRAEQRSSGQQLAAQRQEILFVSSCAMQQ